MIPHCDGYDTFYDPCKFNLLEILVVYFTKEINLS